MNSKDNQISWQGIFKGIMQQEKDALKAEDLTYAIWGRLQERFPLEEKQTLVVRDNTTGKTATGTKICPVPDCGSPMIRQTNKKNPKAPDWKCSNKNCKFQKMMGGGWKKSEFITGIWDESPADKSRMLKSMHNESDYESNLQENLPTVDENVWQ